MLVFDWRSLAADRQLKDRVSRSYATREIAQTSSTVERARMDLAHERPIHKHRADSFWYQVMEGKVPTSSQASWICPGSAPIWLPRRIQSTAPLERRLRVLAARIPQAAAWEQVRLQSPEARWIWKPVNSSCGRGIRILRSELRTSRAIGPSPSHRHALGVSAYSYIGCTTLLEVCADQGQHSQYAS